MLLAAELVRTEPAQKTGQLFEKDGESQDSNSLESTFAEIMRASPGVAKPDLLMDRGEALPQDGESLPPELELDSSQLELPLEAGLIDPIPERLLPDAGENETAVVAIPDASPLPTDLPIAGAMTSLELRQQIADSIGAKDAGRRTVADTEGRVPGSRLVQPQLPQPVIPVERIPMSVVPVDAAAVAVVRRSVAGNETTDVLKRPTAMDFKDAYPYGGVSPAYNAQANVPLVTAIDGERTDQHVFSIDSQLRAASSGPVQTTPTFVDLAPIQTVSNAATRTPPIVTTISLPVSDAAWGSALQNRVLWMTGGDIQRAEVRLNPSELGPIRIRVTVEGDVAQLAFTAQHPVTREAIEMAMPRLREMLGDNGLSMAGFSVDDSADSDVDGDEHGDDSVAADADDDKSEDFADAKEAPVRKRAESALVDTFV